MIKGILFDMDGVLLDTERLGLELLPKVAARHGFSFSEALYLKVLGVNHELGKRILLGELGSAFPYEKIMEEFLEAFLDHARAGTLPLKEGLEACLAGLKARGLLLALATSTSRPVVDVYLRFTPLLRDAFDAIVCGSEVAQSKPAPDIYLRAAGDLGLSPQECIGVEDSLNGLKSLTAAGIPSVMIPDLLPYGESMGDIVTWKLSSLTELCPLIDSLNRSL